MKNFKYENTVLSTVIYVVLALVFNTVLVFLTDLNYVYYIFLAIMLVLITVAFEFMSYKNVFTKTGEYRIEGMSIYIKKSKGEIEIPMDMVDDIYARRTSYIMCSYNLNIKVGRKTYVFHSESLSKKCNFTDTTLYTIVEEIVNANPQLEYLPPAYKNNSYVWKYKK